MNNDENNVIAGEEVAAAQAEETVAEAAQGAAAVVAVETAVEAPAEVIAEAVTEEPVEVPAAEKKPFKKAPPPPPTPKTVPTAKPEVKVVAFEVKTVAEKDGRNERKVRQGIVVSDRMDKTIVVAVKSRAKHPMYKKTVNKTTKFKVHDENNECGIGDTVEIMETRHLSRDKYFRLVRIVEKAK